MNKKIKKIMFLLNIIYLKTGFFIACRFNSQMAAKIAFNLFINPHRISFPYQKYLSKIKEQSTLETEYGLVSVYRFYPIQPVNKRVLLLHGWSNSASHLQPIINTLLNAGCEVICFDQPGHGESQGKEVALPVFVSTLNQVIAKWGSFNAAVGHSLGGTAAAYVQSFNPLAFGRLVLIASLADVVEVTRRFSSFFSLGESVRLTMQQKIEALMKDSMDNYHIEAYGKSIDVPVLIFHCENDLETPVNDALLIHNIISNSKLIKTKNLGHNRILRDLLVLEKITEFIIQDS